MYKYFSKELNLKKYINKKCVMCFAIKIMFGVLRDH